MATGLNRLGSSAYTTTPPPIIQAAKRNCAWYKNEIKRLAAAVTHNAEEYRKAVKEFKESGEWKEEFKTWGRTCREVLQLTPQHANTLIRELTENYYEESEAPPSVLTKLPPAEHIKEKASEPEVKEQEEEPEKPAVHSADEKVAATNGHVKPKENGKPKYLLAIWGELETSLGRSLNRADELNRQCHNPYLHDLFVEDVKKGMETLKRWRELVK